MTIRNTENSNKDHRFSKLMQNKYFDKALLSFAVLILLISVMLPALNAAAITEYNLPPGSTKPYGLTSDGSNLWIAEFGSDRIARMNQANAEIFEFYLPTGSRPYDIAWQGGADERVWFTESSTHKIAQIFKIDPTTYGMAEYALPGEAGPRGIALQFNYINPSTTGTRIWFTEYDRGAIGALWWDGVDRSILEWYLPDDDCRPLSLLYSNTTGVWFTEFESHRIANFNPATNELKEWPLKSGSYPWGISNDTYGNMWFTMSGSNKLGKLNPSTNEITEYHIPTPNSQPYGITVDKYNNVWFVEHSANKIVRFTPGSNVFTEFNRALGGAPFDIIWEEGSVDIWFSDEGGNRIGLVDTTKATTSMTVSTITTAITESSTATTIGSSTATSIDDAPATETSRFTYTTTQDPSVHLLLSSSATKTSNTKLPSIV